MLQPFSHQPQTTPLLHPPYVTHNLHLFRYPLPAEDRRRDPATRLTIRPVPLVEFPLNDVPSQKQCNLLPFFYPLGQLFL
jgi:hypothetical protein